MDFRFLNKIENAIDKMVTEILPKVPEEKAKKFGGTQELKHAVEKTVFDYIYLDLIENSFRETLKADVISLL